MIANATFFVGISATMISATRSTSISETKVDFTEYPVELSELAVNPKQYDGKIIHVKGWINHLDGTVLGNMEFGNLWMRAVCVAESETCSKLKLPQKNGLMDGVDGYQSGSTVCAEVVGRFRMNATDPHPLQRGEKVNLLEISKVINIPPQGQGQGQGHGTGIGNWSERSSASGSGTDGSY